jgi:hypothetical protein
MYVLVDNQMNKCWAFQESRQEIEDILAEQKNPSFYRIEEVKKEDFFDKNGNLIRQNYHG